MFFRQGSERKKQKRGGFRGVTLRANARGGRSSRVLRRVFSVMVIFAAIGGACASAWFGFRRLGNELLANNDLFRLRETRITARGTMLCREKIFEALSLGSCSNIFAIDIDHARRDFLLSVPQARSASFSRQLPGTLLIEVEERLPLARIESDSGAFLALDREGMVIVCDAASQAPAIKRHGMRRLVPGQSLATNRVMIAVALLDLCETTKWLEKLRVAEVDLSRADQLELTLKSGERIALAWSGMADNGKASLQHLEAKMEKLVEVLRSTAALGKRIDYADLTLDRNIPVRYK